MPNEIILLSPDQSLAEVIGEKLGEWGLLFQAKEELPGAKPDGNGQPPVILLDVRDKTGQAIDWLRGAKKQDEDLEVILINRPEQIETSIAGMRAGAADELTVPIDLSDLRKKIVAAMLRLENRAPKSGRKRLARLFHETMSAITFAQAGEFDTARDFLSSAGKEPDDTDSAPGAPRAPKTP